MQLDQLIHDLTALRSVAARGGETETHVLEVHVNAATGHVVVTKASDVPKPVPVPKRGRK